mmetsp:Transcript_45673/g.106019  ORF Transcript_45673/g.106019 Transcript_45673/m.106019 type:complete len:329 (-) Transcript_45673:6-992(-)
MVPDAMRGRRALKGVPRRQRRGVLALALASSVLATLCVLHRPSQVGCAVGELSSKARSPASPVVELVEEKHQDAQAIRAKKLGFELLPDGQLRYMKDFKPLVNLTCVLVMVPHGQTPSNVELLFQNHSDGGYEQLLTPEGRHMVHAGAAEFIDKYGTVLHETAADWVLYRSPLNRTAQTAEIYMEAFDAAGIEVPQPVVDRGLIEIDAGSWHGYTVEGLGQAGREVDAEAAMRYRSGSFEAKASDGSGESLIDLMARAAKWLGELERRHGGSNAKVLVFGHGTFQNAVEVLLRAYPRMPPQEVFARGPGRGHLRRGAVHLIANGMALV